MTSKSIKIGRSVREENNRIADLVHEASEKYGFKVINIMGSIGSGKTSVLEFVTKKLVSLNKTVLVINGDLATSIDSDRLSMKGATTVQINTGRGCHLNAIQVYEALEQHDWTKFDFIFIENVGNLICPTGWRLGANKRVIVTSTPEGEWVVQKHPLSFKDNDVVIINKVDLAVALEISIDNMISDIRMIEPDIPIYQSNARKGEGLGDFVTYILNL